MRGTGRLAIVCAAALVVLMPASLGAASATALATEFQPLEEGTTWVYDYKAVMRFTIQSREHTQTLPARVTTRAEGKETRQGQEYTRVVSVYEGIPGFERQVIFQRVDAAGLHTAVDEGGQWTDRLVLVLPAKVGTTWSMDTRGGERRTIKEVVAVDTPWRRFTSCLKVIGEISGDTPGAPAFTTEEYFCPGFGEVRTVIHGSRPDAITDVEMTLVSFSAPAAAAGKDR